MDPYVLLNQYKLFRALWSCDLCRHNNEADKEIIFLLFSINMQNLVELRLKLTKILNLGLSPLFSFVYNQRSFDIP